MKKKIFIRIILGIIVFCSGFTGAWWIIFPVGIICAWHYRRFFEFPLAALVFDVIYSAPRERLFGVEYVYTLIAVVLFVLIVILKSKVRKNLWPGNF